MYYIYDSCMQYFACIVVLKMKPPCVCEICGRRPSRPFVSLRLVNTKPNRRVLRGMASGGFSIGWCGHPSYVHWVCRSKVDVGDDDDNEYRLPCPARDNMNYFDSSAFALEERLPVTQCI